MSKNKSRKNKQHNKMAGALASARLALKNVAVFNSQIKEGDKPVCTLIDFKNMHQLKVTTAFDFAITKTRHKWSVNLIAVGKESNGKKRFEVEEISLNDEVYHDQLIDYVNEVHKALAERFSIRNELTNVAWIASPIGQEINNETIDQVLTRYRAW